MSNQYSLSAFIWNWKWNKGQLIITSPYVHIISQSFSITRMYFLLKINPFHNNTYVPYLFSWQVFIKFYILINSITSVNNEFMGCFYSNYIWTCEDVSFEKWKYAASWWKKNLYVIFILFLFTMSWYCYDLLKWFVLNLYYTLFYRHQN